MPKGKKKTAKKAAKKSRRKRKIPESKSELIDRETREAFVAGKGVPRATTGRREPVDVMKGVHVEKEADMGHSYGFTPVGIAEAARMEPTSRQSIRDQFDELVRSFDALSTTCAIARLDFVRHLVSPNPESLKGTIDHLDTVGRELICLRNSLATHCYNSSND